ncbi:hypothetical protein RAM19_05755 [Bartonella apihabitans]|nr:hypothetical protein [Bartonella apihabitans]WLT09635.1 hypothetical protein RAM19_05755 [Bartonella apihabitans]
MTKDFVTQKEFAEICGVSKAAVTKWKSKGLLVFGENNLVNVAATQEKLENRPAKYRGGTAKTFSDSNNDFSEPVDFEDDDNALEENDDDNISHAEATRRKEVYLARCQKIKYEKEIGKLVDADVAAQVVANEYAKVRSKILSIPTRTATRLSVMKNPAEIKKYLDEEIADALNELTFDDEMDGKRQLSKEVAANEAVNITTAAATDC